VGADLAARLSRHRAWDLFEHLAARLPKDATFTPTQLASLLLDRSTPRPASLRAAGPWWEEVVAGLAAGRVIPEALWAAEEEVAARIDDKAGRRQFDEALAGALAAGGAGGAGGAEWPAEGTRRTEALMGAVMPGLRGLVPGQLVREWLEGSPKEARS
jgi:hypothetical protein